MVDLVGIPNRLMRPKRSRLVVLLQEAIDSDEVRTPLRWPRSTLGRSGSEALLKRKENICRYPDILLSPTIYIFYAYTVRSFVHSHHVHDIRRYECWTVG